MAGVTEWIIGSFNKYAFPSQVLGPRLMDLSKWSSYLPNVISSRFKTDSVPESCITVRISSITISRTIENCFSLCSSLRKLIVPRNSCTLQTEIHESTFWNDLWTFHSVIAQSFRLNYSLFVRCIRLARTPIRLRVRDVVDGWPIYGVAQKSLLMTQWSVVYAWNTDLFRSFTFRLVDANSMNDTMSCQWHRIITKSTSRGG
jgi:hypothetical protein